MKISPAFLKKKLCSPDAAAQAAQAARESGQKVVFTNGCFDLIHPGHIDYLAKSALLGDLFIIGLNSDSSVKSLKGKSRPIQNENSRAMVLSAFAFVDMVVLFSEPTPETLIRAICPDILVKGGDYRFGDIAGAKFVASNGGSIVLLPYISGYSTTSLEDRIRMSD